MRDKGVNIKLPQKDVSSIEDLEPKSVTGYVERWGEALVPARKMTMASLRGTFDESELKFLLHQGHGRKFDSRLALKKGNLKLNIEDACEYDDLDKDWKIDPHKVLKKIEQLSPLEVYFLNDWVDLYWSSRKDRTREEDYIKVLLK